MHKKDYQNKTSEIFYKIHSKATIKDLEKYKKNIISLIHKNLRGKDILEVGCGGRASGIYALSSYHPKSITAIDLSLKNVINTRMIAKRFGIKAIIKQGNAMSLDFADDEFDFVFSNGVVHHTPDPYQCFKELTRVLKPGHYLFLGIYGYGSIFGKIIHPFFKFISKLIPFDWIEKIVNRTGLLKSQENSILDLIYTPIQKTYNFSEILKWFKEFKDIKRLKSPKWFYRMPLLSKLIFGDGYIYVIAKKR